MLITTSEILKLTTSTAVSVDYQISYVDITTSAFTPATTQANIAAATTTTVLSAPLASTQRQLKYFSVVNKGTSSNTVTVLKNNGATDFAVTQPIVLNASEMLVYTDGQGWQVLDVAGRVKTSSSDVISLGGYSMNFLKVGTAPEAAGIMYSYSKDSGFPGAFAVGTPGVAGRITDGTSATDAGCLPYKNAATGTNYLSRLEATSTVVNFFQLFDYLWVNSGLVVTTTTAQTVNSITLPARDLDGTTNGLGLNFGILVTTATTNAGAITTITASYTNSDNTSGKTATIASFPATAVIGSFIPFQLAAGDKGVRSIQSITLGTTLTAGAISLVIYRVLDARAISLVNSGSMSCGCTPNTGVKLYNGTCMIPTIVASGTGAVTSTGSVTIIEK